jgi:hypothetical protein
MIAESIAWPLGKLEDATSRRWGTMVGRGRAKRFFNAAPAIPPLTEVRMMARAVW